MGLATSTEQVSLVMHHRALGSLHLTTEGDEGGGKVRKKHKGSWRKKGEVFFLTTEFQCRNMCQWWQVYLDVLWGCVTRLEVTQVTVCSSASDTTRHWNLFECTSLLCSTTADSYTRYFRDDQKHQDDVFSVSVWAIFIRKTGRKPNWGETKQKEMYLVKTMPLPPAESQLHGT